MAEIIARDHGFVQVAFADVLKRVLQEIYGFTDEQLWGPSETRDKPDGRYRRDGSGAQPPAVEMAEYCDQEVLGPTFDQILPGDEPWGAFLTVRTALLKLGDALRDCYPHTIVDYGMRVGQRLINKPEGFAGYAYNRKHGLYPAGQLFKGVVFSDARLWRELEQAKLRGGHLVRVTRPGAELGEEAAGHLTESEMDSIPDSEFHYVLANDGTLEDLPGKITEMMEHLKANPTYLQQYPGVDHSP